MRYFILAFVFATSVMAADIPAQQPMDPTVRALIGYAKQHDDQLIQISAVVDRLTFIMGELQKQPTLKTVIENADKEWQSKFEVIKQQAALIETQKAKLAEQERKIAELTPKTEAREK